MKNSTINFLEISNLHKKISSKIKETEILCGTHVPPNINHNLYTIYDIFINLKKCSDIEEQTIYLENTYNELLCVHVELTDVLFNSVSEYATNLLEKYPDSTVKYIANHNEIFLFLVNFEYKIKSSRDTKDTNTKLVVYEQTKDDFKILVEYYNQLKKYQPAIVKAHKHNIYTTYAPIIISILVAFFVGIKAIKN